ncbi:VanZ like protein [Phyllobacterium myrsinacearum]|nr:VanZ like protein [Phyllobacterium myrsinacearum]
MRYGIWMKLIQITAWLLFAAILFITVDPISLRPESGLPVNVERFGAFAVLGFVFAAAYPRRWLLILVLVVGAAFGFELAQMLAPTRHARLMDAVVKAAGGTFGVAASALILRLLR